MSDPSSHEAIESLLGVYALDAVDPDEARLVEQHLLSCPRCREEVSAHREVASLLGNVGGEAPEQLWEQIAGALEEDGDQARGLHALAPLLSEHADLELAAAGPRASSRARPSRRRLQVGLAALAACLAVTVGLLSAKVADLNDQVSHVEAALVRTAPAREAAAAELLSHRSVVLTSRVSGAREATIVALPSGTAYLSSRLAGLGSGRTYQLWARADGRLVSLGVLGRSPSTVAIHVASDMSTFMITAEPAGGTTKPTTPVIAEGTLS